MLLRTYHAMQLMEASKGGSPWAFVRVVEEPMVCRVQRAPYQVRLLGGTLEESSVGREDNRNRIHCRSVSFAWGPNLFDEQWQAAGLRSISGLFSVILNFSMANPANRSRQIDGRCMKQIRFQGRLFLRSGTEPSSFSFVCVRLYPGLDFPQSNIFGRAEGGTLSTGTSMGRIQISSPLRVCDILSR